MIKIIEHGARKEQRCENCGCLFSYEVNDIEKGNSAGICGMELYKTSYKFVRCPQCKKEIVLENVLEEVRQMIELEKGTVGRNAYRVSKVWKLGFHSFINGGDYILRICYLRTKKHTYYVQVSFKTKDISESPMIKK